MIRGRMAAIHASPPRHEKSGCNAANMVPPGGVCFGRFSIVKLKTVSLLDNNHPQERIHLGSC